MVVVVVIVVVVIVVMIIRYNFLQGCRVFLQQSSQRLFNSLVFGHLLSIDILGKLLKPLDGIHGSLRIIATSSSSQYCYD